ncbi:MAG: type VII toxin-antitoxin system HepT family RNase toxin [Anaerolineae bacterium]
MSRVDVERVKERAREVRESLEKIHRYAALPDDEFFADERNLYTVMHLLLISIEAVAGLCSHVLAKTARKAPASYADCFEGLRETGILDDDLAGRLVRMSRFRNLLVHRYWEVEPARVLRYARENLGDFEDFLEAVEAAI